MAAGAGGFAAGAAGFQAPGGAAIAARGSDVSKWSDEDMKNAVRQSDRRVFQAIDARGVGLHGVTKGDHGAAQAVGVEPLGGLGRSRHGRHAPDSTPGVAGESGCTTATPGDRVGDRRSG